MKNQKGITLVALVITIIVLLILAGVSISLVLGQNGVLTQASNAVKNNDAAVAEQEVKLAAADAVAKYYEAWTTDSTTTKSSAYTKDVFKNNCPSASELKYNVGASTVLVKYVSSNNTTYYFNITIDSGKVEATTAPATAPTWTDALSN